MIVEVACRTAFQAWCTQRTSSSLRNSGRNRRPALDPPNTNSMCVTIPSFSIFPSTSFSIHLFIYLTILLFGLPTHNKVTGITATSTSTTSTQHPHPQTNLISLDGLSRFIHSSQLTAEFDGSLSYDNDEWISLRLVCVCLCASLCMPVSLCISVCLCACVPVFIFLLMCI